MVWSRDWEDTWCGLGTGTIYIVWSRDWNDTWCGLGTWMIHSVV